METQKDIRRGRKGTIPPVILLAEPGRPEGTPPPLRRGGLEGQKPLQKTPSSALSLPCEIVSISQGRPLLAPEFTTSGQEEAGKGLKNSFLWRELPPRHPFQAGSSRSLDVYGASLQGILWQGLLSEAEQSRYKAGKDFCKGRSPLHLPCRH
jgi:hypothetical protein